MIHKHNSSRVGSPTTVHPAEFTIRFKDGLFRIYDKQQRFRCGFATQALAQEYVNQRSGAPSHNKALSDITEQVTA